jgi:DNA-binding winged helix-turn-helix (wHTH) protein
MIFSLPYATVVKQGYRITWNSRVFEIERVEEPGTYPMQITAIGLERIV